MQHSLFFASWNKQYKNLLEQNYYDQKQLNNLQKINSTFELLKRVLDIQKNQNISIRQALINLNLSNQKSKIYHYLKRINTLDCKNDINQLLLKNTGPKNIKYVYDQETRKLIADAYYIYHFSKTNI